MSTRFRYEEIADQLSDRIRATYSPGDRLPSERDLCDHFAATRNTIRSAVETLVRQGYVESRGRSGNYVTDYGRTTFDDKLICLVMPTRGHRHGRIFSMICSSCAALQRQSLVCDLTDPASPDENVQLLPADLRLPLLSQALAYRPRTVITTSEIADTIAAMNEHFVNLVVLDRHPPFALARTAGIRGPVVLGWCVAAETARRAGYQDICIIIPPGFVDLARLQELIASAGGFPMERQHLLFEHQPGWEGRLLTTIQSIGTAVAVVSGYDYGAKLALDVVRSAGLRVPDQVGIYGRFNTPWSAEHGISTVDYPPAEWARMILQGIAFLDAGQTQVACQVRPQIIERGSSLPTSIRPANIGE